MWVLTCDRACGGEARESAGRAVHIDPGTGGVLGSVPVSAPQAIAAGEGAVWVATFWEDTVIRIDPTTYRVAARTHLLLPFEVAAGDHRFLPFDIAAGEGGVWVTSGRGAIARIDPQRNQVEATIVTSPQLAGHVTSGEEAVWVVGDLGVSRIDPSTNEVVAGVEVDSAERRLAIDQVAVAAGSVWASGTWAESRGSPPDYVLTDQGGVVHIEPSTNGVIGEASVPGGSQLLWNSEEVWTINQDGSRVSPIDSETTAFGKTIEAPPDRRFVAVTRDSLWVIGTDGKLRALRGN